jgi:hypothetical protein
MSVTGAVFVVPKYWVEIKLLYPTNDSYYRTSAYTGGKFITAPRKSTISYA